MTYFKLSLHGVTGRQIVEVHDDRGSIVAAIYPNEEGVHIVSAHFVDDPISQPPSPIPMPSYLVRFKKT